LRVPGALVYRDLAVRAVQAACKLVGRLDGSFDDQVVSAFSEAFNNAALHSYKDRPGEIDIEIELTDNAITLRISDEGEGYDPEKVPAPDLAALPESGMGLYIIRSFMDEVVYKPGKPNVLTMSKKVGSRR